MNYCQAAGQFLLDLVFPIACLGCNKEAIYLCQNCLTKIPIMPMRHCAFCNHHSSFGEVCNSCRGNHTLSGALSFVPYTHPLLQAVTHAWKYQAVQALTSPLANCVERGIGSVFARMRERNDLWQQGLSRQTIQSFPVLPTLLFNTRRETIMVPIPLHRRRLAERGFNQAELLALALAEQMPERGFVVQNLLRRARATASQATLAGVDRVFNMKEAFILSGQNISLAGKDILLVDDVITTGSTCETAAQVLKNAGARTVWALTIAYGNPL